MVARSLGNSKCKTTAVTHKIYVKMKIMQIEIINNNNILKTWYRILHDLQLFTIITVRPSVRPICFLHIPTDNARPTSMKFLLRIDYVVLTTFLLRPVSATSSLRLFLKHVQSSTTPFTSMKTLLRSYWFLLRSYYVLQVLTASIQFFKDVVRTWLSVKKV